MRIWPRLIVLKHGLSTAFMILCLSTLIQADCWAQIEDPDEEFSVEVARQNASLREYFRRLYPAGRGEFRRPSDDFVENFIDRQIDHFSAELDKKIRTLGAHLTVAENLRMRLLPLLHDETKREAYLLAQKAFEAEMKRVENFADDLADLLSLTVSGLKRKRKVEEVHHGGRGEHFYGEDLAFIRHQFEVAEREIRDYFFRRQNTVELEDLRGQNMLVRLYWIEQQSKAIRKDLD